MNLETLRRKRAKRLGVKVTTHTGQRRIFFVLDRATRKFQGDIGLWMQYLSFARKQKSNKKVSEILTRVLRLHPAKPEFWIYAASYAMEERADMQEARSYMQRGLRFCQHSGKLWLEYGRLEMIYIAKIVGRRQILGLDLEKQPTSNASTASNGVDEDIVALPQLTAEDMLPEGTAEAFDEIALEKLEKSPALSGAIPMAIFDSACQNVKGQNFPLDFFDAVADFDQVPCNHAILNHILDGLRPNSAQRPEFLARHIRKPVISVKSTSPAFPRALGSALSRISPANKSLGDANARRHLNHGLARWLWSFLGEDGLDPDVQEALTITLRKVWTQYQNDIECSRITAEKPREVTELLEAFEAKGLKEISEAGRSWASRMWPEEHSLTSDALEQ